MEKIKVTDGMEFIAWIHQQLSKYDQTPGALVCKSYYVFDFSEYEDKDSRRFEKLRAIAEHERALYYQKARGL